jgi:transcriptional regulator with XRE-family HTH domain
MTLKDLAEQCSCSSGYLSRVETGAVNPSLATLMAISEALGVTVDELFNSKPAVRKASPCLMHPHERKTLIPKENIHMQLLSRGIDTPFEFLLLRFPPGATDGIDAYLNEGADLHTHEGVECGMVIQGRLEVHVEDQVYTLQPGDSITFNSNSPHKISNTGSEEVVAIWVDSKPFLFSTI